MLLKWNVTKSESNRNEMLLKWNLIKIMWDKLNVIEIKFI